MCKAAFVTGTPLSSVRAGVRGAVTVSRHATGTRVTTTMSLRKHAARVAMVPPALLTALPPALATEGTGEGLGIDTPLLYIPLVLVPAVLFVFFVQFGRSQSNDDFIGPYDDRRN